MKKLALYVHHNPKGEVEDYIICCLKGLKEVVSEILFIVNGNILPQARTAVEQMGIKILVRENEGFDWWAWKAGIEYYGYKKIAQYDELLLTNNTYYGPVYPFSEMWSEMDKRDCDFWGITMHPQTNKFLSHIQSYWIVFRKSVLSSKIFKQYWQQLTNHQNYQQMVKKGEEGLTAYFKNNGFKSDTYINFKKYGDLLKDNPIMLTDKMVLEDRCPVIKRKYFVLKYISSISDLTLGWRPRNFLEELKEKKLFDVGLIWQDLLKNHDLSELNDNLNLNYILPTNKAVKVSSSPKVALVLLITRIEMEEYCFSYIKNLPSFIDIYVVTTTQDVKQRCQESLSKLPNKSEIRIQINRGRDNAALLITCKDIISKYEYLCFVHSKKSGHVSPAIQGEEFCNHNFISLLWNNNYINNILTLFEQNPYLGMLIPFVFQSRHYNILGGNEWGSNYNNTKDFFRDYLGINVRKLDHFVMAPYGGMFWCRTKALKTLSSYDWKVTDFPREPLSKTDGLLTHSIERSYCICAQYDGFYSAYVAPDFYGSCYLNNYLYFTRKVRTVFWEQLKERYPDSTFFEQLRKKISLQQNKITSSKHININNLEKYLRRYHRNKFLSHITFGRLHQTYKEKSKKYKNILQCLKA